MKFKKVAILVLASLFLFLSTQGNANAQSQVQVTITGIPQILPSPYISDFEQNVFAGNYQAQLNIMGASSPVTIEFHVRVTLDSEVLVDETSLPATFDPGFHVLSPFSDFVEFEATTQEVLEKLPSSRFRQAFQTGSFPEGNYTITIEPQVVGSQIPGIQGVSNFMVRYPQPPTLVTPNNGAVLSEIVSTPVFTWSPVMGPPGTTFEYEFLLVELYDDQNPGDAIVSNREHASTVLTGNTTIPYTANFLPLEEGKTYAWQVTARDVNGEIPIKNEGRSEIYVFTYGSEDDELDDLTVETPETTEFPQTPVFDINIPVTTISGNVNWKFRPTEGHESFQPVNSQYSVNLTTTNNSQVQTAIDDPNYSYAEVDLSDNLFTDGTSTEDESTAQQAEFSAEGLVPVYGGGTSGDVQVQDFGEVNNDVRNQLQDISDQMLTHPMAGAKVKALVEKDGEDHVIATTTADENGAYTLSITPSELDRLLSDDDEEESQSTGNSFFENNNQENRTIDVQNTNTNVSQLENTELAVASVQIVVDSPYFSFSEEKFVTISTKNAKSYNAGTITGTALTYRLDPTILDREDDQPISSATIEVFRPVDWYDVVSALEGEGWPLDPEDEGEEEFINGTMQVKVAEGSADQIITRLFPRKKGQNDRYTIRISAEGFNPKITHFSSSPDLSEDESVTIEKTYRLQEALPVVEGRVVRRDTQAPLSGVPVALQAPEGNSGNQISAYIATTDSDGRFTISDVATRDEPYTLVVSGSKVSKYQEELLLNERGLVIERDPLMVDPTLITVVGKVVNDESVAVSNATVKWQDGGTPVQTDQHGRFVTANTAGTHVLQIRKIGHNDVDSTITVEISDDSGSGYSFARDQFVDTWDSQDASNLAETTGQWANTVINTESFQIEDTEGDETFSFGDMGYAGDLAQTYNIDEPQIQQNISENNLNISPNEYSSAAEYLMNMMGENGSPGETQDIGNIIISRAVGKLDVTVQAASDSNPISDATVEVGSSGLSGTTDDQGGVYFGEAPGGTVPVRVTAPLSTNFVPKSTEVTIADNGDVTSLTINLDLGGRAVGTVTANGNPVEGASIRLEGRDDINTTTASDGTYTLPGIPTGEWTLKASKSGFVGASQTATFSEDGEEAIDFSLTDSGFNIASLLGFEIEVDELSTESDTTISGAFVSIPSNDLLSISSDFRIPFSNINVYEDNNGTLKPVGGEVQTDMSEFNATIFDYLQVTISNQNGLIVRSRQIPSDIGYIAGKVEVDYESTFTSATGWEWPQAADQFLELPNTDDLPEGVGEEELVTLTSDGSFPFPDIGVPDFELRFGSASETFQLYGFDVSLSLNESVLKNDGFHMSGDVTLSEIPLLDEATVSLEQLWIGTDGTVRDASLDLDPEPELELANWALELASGALSENGFAFGGSIEMNIPGSDPTEVSFSDLSISPDQIFGGQFSLPSGGLDVFGIVQLQSKPGTDISFGKVQNEDIYFVTGAAKIDLPKYIDKTLEFKEFLVRTDGQFSANIVTDFEADFFGLADLTVNGVEFENVGTPSIYVDGQFGLRAIPFVNAQAGGITYQPGGNVSVDEIDLDFDIVGVADIGVGIGFVDTDNRTGFRGSGDIGITGTPINAGIDFFYERASGGVAFGADIEAGIPPIPIGNVTLAELGGGFEYRSFNSEIEVTLRGTITVAPGTGAVVALDPLEVSVEAGDGAPVIEGFAQLTVMTQQIADASLTIDFGKPFFDLEANVGFEKLDDVNINVDGSARLVVSGEPGDTYWMVGARYNAELLELFNANANLLAAWQLDVSSHPEYNQYTDFVSSDYITGGTITGVHLDVSSEFGIPESDKKCIDFKVGEACGWFYNSTRCKLNADFQSTNLGLYLGSNWGGGGNVDFAGFDVIGASVSASGSIEGSYRNNVWSANGKASADLSAYVGNCNVGCQTKVCFWGPVPDGASLCASGSIEVDYRSNRGMQISVSLDT